MIQISILSKIVLTNNKFKNISEKKQNFSYKLKFIKIVTGTSKTEKYNSRNYVFNRWK